MVLSLLCSSKSRYEVSGLALVWYFNSKFSRSSCFICSNLPSRSLTVASNSSLSPCKDKFCFSTLLLINISSSLCSSASCTRCSSCFNLKSKLSVLRLYSSLWLICAKCNSCSKSLTLLLYFLISASYSIFFYISFLFDSREWVS